MSKTGYQWKTGSRFSGDARETMVAITSIHKSAKREISPEDIVQYAESDPVLNGYFEWDDSIAGFKFRCWQARHLVAAIVQVTVDESGDKQETPVFVNVVSGERQGYLPVKVACKRTDTWEYVQAEALAYVERFADRYNRLAAVPSVQTALSGLVVAIRQIRKPAR